MRRVLSCLPLALLFLASVVPSNGQSTEAGAADEAAGDKVEYYDLRGNFTLDCTSLAAGASEPVVWRRNGTVVEAGAAGRLQLLAAGAVLALRERAVEADWGNYSCSVGGLTRTWQLRGRPHAKLPPDSAVVEGQKLKLVCKLVGRPYPPVVWTFSNTSETVENGTDVRLALAGRVTIKDSDQGVPGGELEVEPAARGDAGWFRCGVAGAAGEGTPAVTRLRVKDMYAALWPFLGICAEVFVLCAIILVYEKRRTKVELEDSDTDNHDQKKS